MLKVIKGDLVELALNGKFDVIIHGCNCQHVMGAGIAAQIKKVFPNAYKADLETPKGPYKLGDYSLSIGDIHDSLNVIIVNAYTQNEFGRNKRHFDYQALRRVLIKISDDFESDRYKFGIPRIGCGLAGGDWAKAEDIILDIMGDRDITVVTL